MLIEKELVQTVMYLPDKESVFNYLSKILLDKGYVTDNFNKKIKEREENYPTGLKLKNIGISIAHTDPECAIEDKIVVLKFDSPVKFVNAETFQLIDVNLVFCLVLREGYSHLKCLQRLAITLQDEAIINKIMKTKNSEELYEIINEIFKGEI